MSKWSYLGYAFVAGFIGLVVGFAAWTLWSLWIAIGMVEREFAALPVGLTLGVVVAVIAFIVLCLIDYGYAR